MNYIIYHNPKCRKSREALKLIEEKNKKFTVIKYLEDNFDEKSLKKVLEIISKKPSEILRKNEEIWKKQFSNKNLCEDQILAIMIKNPKLIERPIVTLGEKGIVARPIEKLIDFIKEN
tara:strand:+ start:2599 stop:2952 length:354 start_codon:yes stop_codon:yes gene_type:complete